MHFVIGLWFLLLTITLIYLYLLVPYVCLSWFNHVRQKRKAEKQSIEQKKVLFWSKKRKKVAISLAIFVSAVSLTIYAKERIKWMGDDNGNLGAKNYYVSGQVLNSFRTILTNFVHPEIPVMAPLRSLQWVIYNQGVDQLPVNDGEVGVWQNQWFHNHYSKKNRQELFLKNNKPTETFRARLDQWWFCLESMATGSYADKQMEEEHYYLDYPSLALSYYFHKGFYANHYAGSAHKLALIAKHVERAKILSNWLWELQPKWQQSSKTMAFIKNNPKLEAMYLYVLQAELTHYLQGTINQHQFSCDNIAIRRYVKARQQFVEPENGRPAYKRMKSGDQANRLYNWSIDNAQARSIRYVLRHYCGVEVVGKEDNSRYASWAKHDGQTPDQESEDRAKLNFQDEIKILERQFNEQ